MFLISAARTRLYGWLSLVSQILIVVTGGAVRLTGSGLGCPTWPKCTDDSLVNVPAQGYHGIIEFTNRTLTGVLVIISLLTLITVWRLAREARIGKLWPAIAILLGIFVQAVVGGITVHMKLNPWIVGLHFAISALLIISATILLWRIYDNRHQPVPYRAFMIAPWLYALGLLTVLFGVLVTGAGPHAGDVVSARNGFDLEVIEHFHSYPAYVTLALAVIVLFLLRRAKLDNPLPQKISGYLVATLIYQAIIGVVQSRLGVPPLLVGLHVLGASLLISLLTFQWLSIRAK